MVSWGHDVLRRSRLKTSPAGHHSTTNVSPITDHGLFNSQL